MTKNANVVGLRGEPVPTINTKEVTDRAPALNDVIIIGVHPDGTLYTDSSNMSNKDSLWLLRLAEQAILMGVFQCFNCGAFPGEEDE